MNRHRIAAAGPDPQDLDPRQRLLVGMERLALPASERQIGQLLGYVDILARWNRVYNLTAVRDPMEMVSRHLLDSLAVSPFLKEGPVLDAGTGPGLPGIPLAVLNPGLSFTLIDANGKKTRFVTQVKAQLDLDNVAVRKIRLESYQPGAKFATITARALTSLARLYASTAHLARRPGQLLALKGRDPHAELATLSLPAADVRVRPLRVPFLQSERHLVVIAWR